MTPNISYRPTRLPDAVPPEQKFMCRTASRNGKRQLPSTVSIPVCYPTSLPSEAYNKYRISLPTFQKIPEFYRFIKSIFYGTRLLPLPRQRTVRTATSPKGRPLSNAAGRNAPPFRETEPADGIPSAGIRQSQPERNRQSRSFRCIRFIRLPAATGRGR